MIFNMKNPRRLMLMLLILCCCSPLSVWANFEEAMKYYKEEKFEVAYDMFERMARIGYYPAQFNLGVMYYQGQFVSANQIRAYAWMSLAGDQDEKSNKTAESVFISLADKDRALAAREATSLRAEYGDDALAESLYPVPLADEDCEPEIVALKKIPPHYPRKALASGNSGNVLVVFDVDEFGSVIKPEVLSGHDDFYESSLISATRYRYQPGTSKSGVMTEIRYQLEYGGSSSSYSKYLQKHNDELKEKADSGRAADKYVYAIHTAYGAEARPEHQVLNQYLLDAAQQGLPHAQYMIGRNLLFGRGCEVDVAKGMEWLKKSAKKDFSPAQYLLAKRIQDEPGDRSAFKLLLENAADSNHSASMLDLAWFLATSKEEADRDPSRALRLAKGAGEKTKDKVTSWQTLAAAYAANEKFDKAVKYQKKAIKKAKYLGWDLALLEHRMDTYQANSMWLE